MAGYATAVVGAYRAHACSAAVKHFPGLGSGLPADRERAGQRGADARGAARPRPRPLPGGLRCGRSRRSGRGHGALRVDDFVTPASLSRRSTTDLLRRRLGSRASRSPTTWRIRPITALGSRARRRGERAEGRGGHALHVRPPRRAAGGLRGGAARGAQSGEIRRRRLDQAVGRILSVKRDYGLIDYGRALEGAPAAQARSRA